MLSVLRFWFLEAVGGANAEDYLAGMADNLIFDLGIQAEMVAHQIIDAAALDIHGGFPSEQIGVDGQADGLAL